jgi:hypothetical protein
MRRYDAVEIALMCRECEKDSRLGADLAGFLRARFSLLPPGAEELAAMFRDLTLGIPCHGTAIQYLSTNRDAFGPAGGETLAAALIFLSDRSAYGLETRRQFDLAAAYLSGGDRVLERIRARLDSDDPAERETGIGMARESRDPRAAGLLTGLMDRLTARGETPSPDLLVVYATKSGRGAYDRIHPFYERAGDAGFRMRALEALCSTTDPRAIRDLLDAYADAGTGIRDSTSRIPDRAERRRYEQLWSCARTLEPAVVASLRGGDPLLRMAALEVADRESRFGPPAEPRGLLGALRAFAAESGQDAAAAKRAMETGSRIELRLREQLLPQSEGR